MNNIKSGLESFKQVIVNLEKSVTSFTQEGLTHDIGVRLYAILNYLDCLQHEAQMVFADLKDSKKKEPAPVVKKKLPVMAEKKVIKKEVAKPAKKVEKKKAAPVKKVVKPAVKVKPKAAKVAAKKVVAVVKRAPKKVVKIK